MVEDRLSDWVQFRNSSPSLEDVAKYWSDVKTIPFNHNLDPYNNNSWPTPWEIINDNVYDDLTLAVMIGYTIRLTGQFKDCQIEVRTMVDSTRKRLYNLVYVDNSMVLNYDRGCVINAQHIPESFFLENLVELKRPR
jgi:hypothetical protein